MSPGSGRSYLQNPSPRRPHRSWACLSEGPDWPGPAEEGLGHVHQTERYAARDAERRGATRRSLPHSAAVAARRTDGEDRREGHDSASMQSTSLSASPPLWNGPVTAQLEFGLEASVFGLCLQRQVNEFSGNTWLFSTRVLTLQEKDWLSVGNRACVSRSAGARRCGRTLSPDDRSDPGLASVRGRLVGFRNAKGQTCRSSSTTRSLCC